MTHQFIVATQATAEAYVARFPAGARVSVYYDPESPANSTLEVGVGPVKHWIAAWIVLTVFFGIGVAIWFWDFF